MSQSSQVLVFAIQATLIGLYLLDYGREVLSREKERRASVQELSEDANVASSFYHYAPFLAIVTQYIEIRS